MQAEEVCRWETGDGDSPLIEREVACTHAGRVGTRGVVSSTLVREPDESQSSTSPPHPPPPRAAAAAPPTSAFVRG